MKKKWKKIGSTKDRIKEETVLAADIELIHRGIKKALIRNDIKKKLDEFQSAKYSYRVIIETKFQTAKGYKLERGTVERKLGQPKNFKKRVHSIGKKHTRKNITSRGFQAIYSALWKQNQNQVHPVIFYDRLRKLSKKRNKYGAPLFRGDRARSYKTTIRLVRERNKTKSEIAKERDKK